jgi:DNA-binding response OmpR family regulator
MALCAVPVFLTGEPAEEMVEGLPGVSEALIGAHEEAAELAIWVMEALGVLSLLALFINFKTERTTNAVMGITFALSLVTFGLMARTGYLGGQIRHTEIRSGAGGRVPIIFLTAKDTVDDAVFALETGANDFIRKPFSLEEMLARIRVLLRSKTGEQTVFRYKSLEMNLDTHRVIKNGVDVELTQKEFALLEYLLRYKGKVCRRTRIIEKVWDINFDHSTAVIDVYINFLRKKLEDPGALESFITTIRGIGYRINDDR